MKLAIVDIQKKFINDEFGKLDNFLSAKMGKIQPLIYLLSFVATTLAYEAKGIPDPRVMQNHLSRSTGTDWILPGHMVVSLLAFVLFVLMMGVFWFYKPELCCCCYRRDWREEKTIFFTQF